MTEKIKIEKINDKVETIEVRGQGCWDDCEIWKNNTKKKKNKCRRDFTAYNNKFK